MVTIKYKSVIIGGIDKTGQVETVDDKKAARLIKAGFAEPAQGTVNRENTATQVWPPEVTRTGLLFRKGKKGK